MSLDGKQRLDPSLTISEYRKTLRQDVVNLFETFQSKGTCSFKVFQNVWKCLDFSLILVTCPEFVAKKWQMDCLYSYGIVQLRDSSSKEIHHGVVYYLYLLYYSQPASSRVPVKIPPAYLEQIIDLYRASQDADLPKLVERMVRSECIIISMQMIVEIEEARDSLRNQQMISKGSPLHKEVGLMSVIGKLMNMLNDEIRERDKEMTEHLSQLESLSRQYELVKLATPLINLDIANVDKSIGEISRAKEQLMNDYKAVYAPTRSKRFSNSGVAGGRRKKVPSRPATAPPLVQLESALNSEGMPISPSPLSLLEGDENMPDL